MGGLYLHSYGEVEDAGRLVFFFVFYFPIYVTFRLS